MTQRRGRARQGRRGASACPAVDPARAAAGRTARAVAGQAAATPDRPRRLLHPAILWSALTVALLRYTGAIWDVSWHRTIGRDTFWSPPHLLLYAGVVLGLAVALWGALGDARGRSDRGRTIPPLADLLRSPYAVPLLGGILMLVSGPFDDAWHAAFGRDVDIWSPPHLLAVLGSAIGALGWAAIALAERRDARTAAPTLVGAVFLGLLLYAGWFALNWYHMVAASRDTLLYPALAALLLLPVLVWATAPGLPTGLATAAAAAFVLLAAVPVLAFPPFGWRAPAAPPLLIVPAAMFEIVLLRLRGRAPAGRAIGAAVVAFAVGFVLVEAARLALIPPPAPFGEDLLIVPPYLERAREWPWTPAGLLIALPVALLGGALAAPVGLWLRRAIPPERRRG